MRAKVPPTERAKQKCISLFPHQLKFANKRANSVNGGVSEYLQTLVDYDEAHDLFPKIIAERLKKN